VDTDGGKWFRRAYPDGVFVFVVAPSKRVLRQRLMRRGVVDQAELSRRLTGGDREMTRAVEYDYLVVNGRLSQSMAALEAIASAERCRMTRQRELLTQLR
ncbi:MAG: guanylate kinase, partial [Sulfobacillus sp.]